MSVTTGVDTFYLFANKKTKQKLIKHTRRSIVEMLFERFPHKRNKSVCVDMEEELASPCVCVCV